MILGADLICGGRPLHRWNFAALETNTKANGNVEGKVVFKRGREQVKVPLV